MRLRTHDGRTLWLAYGMNVHPGGGWRQTVEAIHHTVLPLKARLGVDGPFGIAVRWSHAGMAPSHDDRVALRATLMEHDLRAFTGNAFVVGEFHGEPLKDRVYMPAWSDVAGGGTAERVDYTLAFAETLALLAPAGSTVSLSTSPCGWKGWGTADVARHLEAFASALVTCADGLRRLHETLSVRVVLGLEPEPGCTIETTAELLAFVAGPLADALEGDDDLRAHLGVCYDVCHQAVEWEDVEANLRAIRAAGLPIVKLQASCALELPDPTDPAGRAALAAFDEPVYLHQVGARDAAGRVHIAEDLGGVLNDPVWQSRGPWRSHFHVPVFRRELLGPLRSTQADLERALRLVARESFTEHIEIETYTWDVLPAAEKAAGSGFELVDALEREMRWVLDVLAREGAHAIDTGSTT
ncbi:MAG: metabolite traffic protein EboE [Planctomycetota bacterium]|nr:metabolite traffic protein EboE [Planctomycetota bacterium]